MSIWNSIPWFKNVLKKYPYKKLKILKNSQIIEVIIKTTLLLLFLILTVKYFQSVLTKENKPINTFLSFIYKSIKLGKEFLD